MSVASSIGSFTTNASKRIASGATTAWNKPLGAFAIGAGATILASHLVAPVFKGRHQRQYEQQMGQQQDALGR